MLLSAGNIASAQERITLKAVAGFAASYLQSQEKVENVTSRILPHLGMYALIPLEGRFALKTGLAYEQKGWKGKSAETDTADNIRHEYNTSLLLHTIHIPLQLCYTVRRGQAFSYSVSAGMSYGFFAKAESAWTIDTYRGERLLRTQTEYWNPVIALIPDESRLKSNYEGASYYLFNTAFRAEASVTWKGRYSLDIFWERGLNNVSAMAGNTAAVRLGYSGIALGINLN